MRPLSTVKEGDTVRRLLSAAKIPMDLRVTKIHEGLIFCGSWTFDLATGIEEDPELGFGVAQGITGSWLQGVLEASDLSAEDLRRS